MDEHHRLTAAPNAGRIDRWLASQLPLSRSRLQALLGQGRVVVDGRVVRASHKLTGGETVEVRVPPDPPSELVAQDLNVPVLHRDEQLLVVVKPADMVVHPSRGHPDGTLVNAVLHEVRGPDGDGPGAPGRPGIVHRLDRGTSGVLVVARTSGAHASLAAQFACHSVERRYLALVWGRPRDDEGTIDAPLARHPKDRLRFAVLNGGRRAVTHWKVLATHRFGVPGNASGGAVSLLEVRLETGRTHQVRVHLSHLGHGIVGDKLYKQKGRTPEAMRVILQDLGRQLLHARILGFDHPTTGERMLFEAPPPQDFGDVLEAIDLPLPRPRLPEGRRR